MDIVPAFLSIDVEPDAFQIAGPDPCAWAGFDAMFKFTQALRRRLERCSGRPVTLGWYLRTDPQIAEVFGHADYLFRKYRRRLGSLVARGDYFGVHSHPIRWSEQHATWVHDFADAEWVAHSVRYALQTFEQGMGTPARRYRSGAGFMSNEMFDVMDECGVRLDLSMEPVAGWGLRSTEVLTSVDGSPMVGAYTDCRTAPRYPYRPSRDDFRIRAAGDGRDVIVVPVTTVTVRPAPASEPQVRVLYPSVPWPDETSFWDLAAEQLESMERPYLSLAIRTDAADMELTARVRGVFDALPRHPIAKRLTFVDPLEVVTALAAA